MELLGDLAFVIGAIGVVVYLCLIVIRYVTAAAKVREAIQRTTTQNAGLEQRLAELRQRRDAADPEVNVLLARVVALREERDRLTFALEEMVARSRERDIQIKTKIH